MTNGSILSDVEIAWAETIRFGHLELITDHFDNLSLSLKGNDSDVVLVGMVHSGLPSLHAILEESTNGDDSTSSDRGSSSFPISELQRGDPDRPHHNSSDHTNGPVMDCRATAGHWTPPRAAIVLSGGTIMRSTGCSDGANSPVSERLLRPSWLNYTNAIPHSRHSEYWRSTVRGAMPCLHQGQPEHGHGSRLKRSQGRWCAQGVIGDSRILVFLVGVVFSVA
jgi:hypothetical protein